MKTLIVYYSKSGVTKKVAENLKEKLNADIEEIFSVKDRAGIAGFMLSGKEGMQRILAEIKPTEKNVADYDLVVVGTPIWGWNMASPIRTYLTQNAGKFKKVAAFCTKGSNEGKAFSDIEEICKMKLAAVLNLTMKEVMANKAEEKINGFTNLLK